MSERHGSYNGWCRVTGIPLKAVDCEECRKTFTRVTKAQGRFLAYLDRAGHASESTAASALYGARNQGGKGALTVLARNLATLGLIEERPTTIRGRRNVWNKTWQRTDKPYTIEGS